MCVVPRLRDALARTPRLRIRLFTAAERDLSPSSLAARFAAKEAVAKALRAPGDGSWHDVEVLVELDGSPVLTVTGACAQHADRLGVQRWHVSLSHDGDLATAFVIAEGGLT